MKTSRMTNQPAQQSDFGLIAWLEKTRVSLPLKGVECGFQITGDIASVELDQIYHQNADRPLDCTYTFPLPAGAAVYRCEVHINGRIIRAKVEEKEAAREIYRTQKAAGRRVALVETERENFFTLSLGNVQPGDVIVVCFAWFQVLERAGDGLRLMVPTCPGVRYIPGKPLLRALSGRGTVDDTDQVPDASRITPPRIDALHPDAAYFCITGRLSASDVESGTASSPSHPIFVREGEGKVAVELSGRAAVPDRDFVLTWKEPKVLQLAPQAWRWNEGKDTYALVQLRAPEVVKVAEGLSQDFYFLVDRSGSMAGAKWQRTCEALRGFVSLLGAQDRVWITLFESEFQDFDAVPVPAPQVLADAGFLQMENIGTAGGTELLPAATHVLEKIAAHSADRRTSVILITDGEVGNDAAILHAFKPAAKVTVHTFGIDTAVNDAFLKSLARQQRGGCWLQTPDDDIAGTVSALGDRLRRPVLSQLAVEGSWETGDGALPDLHAREVVTVALRGTANGAIRVTGCLPDGTAHSFTVEIGSVGSEAVKLLWARQRIAALLAAGQKQKAITLAKAHNLICEGAAFIAWDEQEQVAIAKDELVQPALRRICAGSVLGAGFPFPSKVHASISMHAAKVVRSRAPGRSSAGDDSALFCKVEEKADDRVREESDRKENADARLQNLRSTLRGGNVPDSAAERLIVWAKAGADSQRTEALIRVMDFIAEVRRELGPQPVLDETIRLLLEGPPEAILQWEERSRPGFDALIALLYELSALEAPDETIQILTAWVVESGGFDQDRIAQISKASESIQHRPFSASGRQQLWLRFLHETVGTTHSEPRLFP
jgi:Ca-activated chloride channel family protein